ncbi:MAG: putative glycosyltransferase EpsE [bacterium ADurb.Bin212]|nr:MAG: putative glycosyltransferase EpsE [bacterium ADurb.Bin212]
MKKKTPKVSVLMPAYNAESYIGVAIESILSQTFRDLELIVIDDSSTDSTIEIVSEFAKNDDRLCIIRNSKNLKISRSLNKGLNIAKGRYVARMDADDWSYSDRIEKQYHFLEKNPKVGIVGGVMRVCDKNLKVIGTRFYEKSDRSIRKKMFRYNPFCHPAIMVRKSIFDQVGGYNVYLADAEDYDLYFRIGNISKFANLDCPIIKYRMNNSSISSIRSRNQERLTIFIRFKAWVEYGYPMKFSDIFYTLAQLLSMLVIPQKLKIKLFNALRNTK